MKKSLFFVCAGEQSDGGRNDSSSELHRGGDDPDEGVGNAVACESEPLINGCCGCTVNFASTLLNDGDWDALDEGDCEDVSEGDGEGDGEGHGDAAAKAAALEREPSAQGCCGFKTSRRGAV